jgi:hypothetical protein
MAGDSHLLHHASVFRSSDSQLVVRIRYPESDPDPDQSHSLLADRTDPGSHQAVCSRYGRIGSVVPDSGIRIDVRADATAENRWSQLGG